MPRKIKKLRYYDNVVQGTDEWRELRENKISGSTAHKLFGKMLPRLSAFNSADITFTGNYATKRGQELEPEAIELYERITGRKVKHTGLVTNDSYENCVYSPDGYLEDRTVEVKCFLPENHLANVDGRVDTKILGQIHFGQVIMEKGLTDLIFYCPKDEVPLDKKIKIITIDKNDAIHKNIKRKVKEINDREERERGGEH